MAWQSVYIAQPWLIIQYNKEAYHQIMVSSPRGGEGVRYPVSQIGNDDSEILQQTSEAKDLIPLLNCFCYQYPSGT